MPRERDIDPVEAKQVVVDYCKRKGALVVGVAELAAVERICPPGHRPSDIMPKVRSVIALGVGGQTRGAWSVPGASHHARLITIRGFYVSDRL